ncbi:MAG TPA: ABC transporter ATP-binding protein [Actinomycetota bacterium]|jgi:branched-chain amino acid transport system ATP-binding protein|nr:ABC transporter ATP-binding protein [Actinomycetota bacterium]
MPLLEVRDVTRRFGSLVALNGVSFGVDEGKLFGIAGPNGAGKSVLFGVISGAYRPSSGSVVFDGHDIVGLGPHEACHRGLVRTFQTPTTFHSLTVRQNLAVGRAFGAGRRQDVEDVVELLDLGDVADRPATNLDLFTTKKVVLGAALATECKLLMLDEPMAGFSHLEIEAFLEIVRRINRERGITVVIIEHLLDILIGITDRMMILHYGEVLFSGDPAEVKRNEKVVEVYLGGAV